MGTSMNTWAKMGSLLALFLSTNFSILSSRMDIHSNTRCQVVRGMGVEPMINTFSKRTRNRAKYKVYRVSTKHQLTSEAAIIGFYQVGVSADPSGRIGLLGDFLFEFHVDLSFRAR